MKYIKLFENNAAYEQYADSAEYVEPHVSLAEQENEIHYNKPPKWIATYADGHTESAWCDGTSEIVQTEIAKKSLVSAEIGDCVTSIGRYVFYGCTSLTSVTIPNTVTNIGASAFNGCKSLTSMTIPNSVTSIGGAAFEQCTSLTSVTIPDSVTFIGDYAFQSCSGLISITCLATTPPRVNSSSFSSTNCPIYVPASSVDAYKSASGWSSYLDRIQPIV